MSISVNYWNRGGLGGGTIDIVSPFLLCVKESRKMIKTTIPAEGHE